MAASRRPRRGPTPTELFVASLASCVAFYAGRYLTRHGLSREGLGVSVAYEMATDRPARVANIWLKSEYRNRCRPRPRCHRAEVRSATPIRYVTLISDS